MTMLRRFRASLPAVLMTAVSLSGQGTDPTWSITGYLQQSWPKQTETNRQIKEDINGGLGTHFQAWEDVPNLNVGLIGLRRLSPGWKVGLELDYSRGRLHGQEAVDLSGYGLGPGSVSFEQKYSLYADLLVMAQYRPLGEGGRWVPFLSGGAGLAYEQDATRLGFASSVSAGDYELLRVDNRGWFPMLTAGLGLDAYLSDRRDWLPRWG